MTDRFLHGHAPGKNTPTREMRRSAAAKPGPQAGTFWPEKPAKRFEGQTALVLGHFLRLIDAGLHVPLKSLAFVGTPQIK